MRFLITTLAEYQTTFWLKVGAAVRKAGHEVAFLSFDDRSSEMLQAAGLRVFSATDERGTPESDDSARARLERFGLDKLNYWFGHERFAFGMRDSGVLRRKLLRALAAADEACTTWAEGGPVTMVQELGGFLSVVGSYFAARHNGIDNWFVEPSFFRGRLFFIRNDFAAVQISVGTEAAVPDAVRTYLADTVSKGAIVVPQKDRHQYTTAWKKIVNRRNAVRLVQKLVDKHVHRKRQEFGHIGQHVRTHARMIWSSLRLRRHYVPLEDCRPFVYYPLHVPGDMALTLRSPHLLDQLALVEFICRSVPPTHQVAIKEHPAMVGAIEAGRVLSLLRRHDNLVVLPPSTNNYKVLSRADLVVSVNSKSGAEAALIGKPVLVLGDAFYRSSPLVTAIDRLQDLPAAIAAALRRPSRATNADDVLRYFAAVWAACLPGELYVADDANVDEFTRSMFAALGRDPP